MRSRQPLMFLALHSIVGGLKIAPSIRTEPPLGS